ncbi:isoprenylcysteine carboxylmethyltransferase family protein [Parasphingorhabdus sp.]|uniref:methyltransferase family protein n=1 Tax=Parasphingorhabdus sp. TaxID=2709688 RepID=UPI002F9276EC
MIQAVPFIALIVIFLASLWRGRSVARSTGNSARAFGSAKGKQRLSGLAFAISIIVLAIASALAAMQPVTKFAWVGALLAVAGAVMVIVSQIQMGRAWRVGVREGDAPLFVRHGLFRFSRNPIFVGMIIIGLSIAVSANIWWAWVALLTFALACHAQVRIEETHLSKSFGIAYEHFCSDVPRWIGISK